MSSSGWNKTAIVESIASTRRDPSWRTGTTSLAALVAAHNSVGYELEAEFAEVDERVADAPAVTRDVLGQRLADHRAFVAEQREAGTDLAYEAEHYDVPVRTKQERSIRSYAVDRVEATPEGYRAVREPIEEDTGEDRSGT